MVCLEVQVLIYSHQHSWNQKVSEAALQTWWNNKAKDVKLQAIIANHRWNITEQPAPLHTGKGAHSLNKAQTSLETS